MDTFVSSRSEIAAKCLCEVLQAKQRVVILLVDGVRIISSGKSRSHPGLSSPTFLSSGFPDFYRGRSRTSTE